MMTSSILIPPPPLSRLSSSSGNLPSPHHRPWDDVFCGWPLNTHFTQVTVSFQQRESVLDFHYMIFLLNIDLLLTTLQSTIYFPKGTAKRLPESFHFTVIPFYIWLKNQTWLFKNTLLYPIFWKSRKPLSPEGKVRKHSQRSPIDFSLS